MFVTDELSQSPAGEPNAPSSRPRVDFYVLDAPSPVARLRTACRIVEKAYLASQSVLVWHTDVDELRQFDEMLWSFAEGSFVPHDVLIPGGTATAPVLLTAGAVPQGPIEVLVNLGPDVPPCASEALRIAEVIDGDAGRRQAGRARFRTYKERGLQPASHNLGNDSLPA